MVNNNKDAAPEWWPIGRYTICTAKPLRTCKIDHAARFQLCGAAMQLFVLGLPAVIAQESFTGGSAKQRALQAFFNGAPLSQQVQINIMDGSLNNHLNNNEAINTHSRCCSCFHQCMLCMCNLGRTQGIHNKASDIAKPGVVDRR